ncbi:LamB/YcsF family protein [Methylobacterium iners]|uniref:5-oxoprolinase subunit A n=1 Tax=Methylobacterium iners TaxID=418707 RepID=A0ABQ4S3Z5_9HYPH|nr:5-oxoprolinase subunit PxpA [Methylobacterium iners]GJD97853.1 5-oxoprolinase subunit A [Methylobacterium iners]
MRIDLNCDLGEGFGAYRIGDDAALLAIVTSANVACGLHAGDPEIMAATFAEAKARGVAVGAHPGFPDLWGFGRRRMPFSASEIERLVAYQVGAAQALAAYAGHRITYVKAHGALSSLAAAEPEVAGAVARAVRAVDPGLALLAIALSAQVAAGEAAELATYQEAFADRGYTEAGGLVPRGQAGDLITDPGKAAAQALRIVEAGGIPTSSGGLARTPIHSICIHGDLEGATLRAAAVRAGLEAAGVTLAAFGHDERPPASA